MIGERLAEIRKNQGDTQAALAQRLQVSLAAVRSWEQKKSAPPHEMLVRICRMYHVSADYLLGLSNVDPCDHRSRKERLTSEELQELKRYKEYLVWKKQKQAME